MNIYLTKDQYNRQLIQLENKRREVVASLAKVSTYAPVGRAMKKDMGDFSNELKRREATLSNQIDEHKKLGEQLTASSFDEFCFNEGMTEFESYGKSAALEGQEYY